MLYQKTIRQWKATSPPTPELEEHLFNVFIHLVTYAQLLYVCGVRLYDPRIEHSVVTRAQLISCLPVLYSNNFVYWKLPSCYYYGIQDSAFVYCRSNATGYTAEWSSLLNSNFFLNLRSVESVFIFRLQLQIYPAYLHGVGVMQYCLSIFKKWKYYCRHLPPEWICFKVVVTWTCCCEWVSEWVRVEV